MDRFAIRESMPGNFMAPITVLIQGSRKNRLQKCRKEVSLTGLVEEPQLERSRMRERCLWHGWMMRRFIWQILKSRWKAGLSQSRRMRLQDRKKCLNDWVIRMQNLVIQYKFLSGETQGKPIRIGGLSSAVF